MTIRNPTPLCLVLLMASVLVLENCGGIMKGDTQVIPVTSTPPGATVFVDGRSFGAAPLQLRLARRADHEVRIEKTGYKPVVLTVTRRPSESKTADLIGDAALGALVGGVLGLFTGWLVGGPDSWPDSGGPGALIGAGAVSSLIILDDSTNGRFNDLSPDVLEVVLTRTEDDPRAVPVRITIPEPGTVRWIKIRLSDAAPAVSTARRP